VIVVNALFWNIHSANSERRVPESFWTFVPS